MLSLDQLFPFLLAVALIELTPGPNMGYLAVVASQSGRAAGMATVAGITLGLTLYLLASVFGLSEAALRWPWIYQTLRWAGVAYLLWLAVDTWRGASPEAPAPDHRSLFLRGLLNNLLNPKAAVFYVVLLPGFIRPQDGQPVFQALMLGCIHITISFLIHTTIVLTASHARSVLQGGDAGKSPVILQRAFAIGLAAIAIWLAVSTPDLVAAPSNALP